jgi:hypothetical protein
METFLQNHLMEIGMGVYQLSCDRRKAALYIKRAQEKLSTICAID